MRRRPVHKNIQLLIKLLEYQLKDIAINEKLIKIERNNLSGFVFGRNDLHQEYTEVYKCHPVYFPFSHLGKKIVFKTFPNWWWIHPPMQTKPLFSFC